MSRARAFAPLLALVLLFPVAAPAAGAEPQTAAPAAEGEPEIARSGEPEIIPGRVVVGWRDAARAATITRSRGLAVLETLDAPAKDPTPTVVSTEGRPVDQVIAELSADPAVAYAEPDYVVHLANEGAVTDVAVNDPLTRDQYSLDRMRVRDAWAIERGGSGIVAVLDTGVQFNHPDLTGRLVAGHDFVNNDSNASDDNGHGTWVAGIIAAKPNDGYGIAGISWSDKVMPVKIMNEDGRGETSDLTSGIVWAANNGADVINMSVGGFPSTTYVQDAINYAWDKGVVLIGAAGNNGREQRFFPASYANVISVSATQRDDEFTHWSSFGPDVDVSAPGGSVRTTNCTTCIPSYGSHTYISGTSFAAPNVAGVVALIQARYPTWSNQQVVNRLFSTVDDLGYAGWDNRYGRGRVNAHRAVGGSSPGPASSPGDALESNNSIGRASRLALGTTVRPSIHPAGDVDFFAVDVPRSGRLDVRVTAVPHTLDYPWNRSTLPIDPVLELFRTDGTRLVRVDHPTNPAATELASISLAGATRIIVKVSNWLANGNRAAYSIRADVLFYGFSDIAFSPFIDDIGWLAQSGITSGCAEDRFCPTAAVTREQMASFLTRAKNLPAASRDYFVDDAHSIHHGDINRLAQSGITGGCDDRRFCPGAVVNREQMASFLARALNLPAATRDYFSDDNGSIHEADINRLAAAGIGTGCGNGRFCPRGPVTREQMAAFLHRAFG
ncbi:MAG: S8 family serine peptidase [Candidatus Limnocylindria bacterium]